MQTVSRIYDYLDAIAPFSAQADWDNSGLLLGRAARAVDRVLVCLDLDSRVAERAAREGFPLVVTHHPVIFRPISSVTDAAVFYPLLAADVAVISVHTNLDIAPGFGVNASLLSALSLPRAETPVTIPPVSPFLAFANVAETAPKTLARQLSANLRRANAPRVLRLTDAGVPVRRVAVCGGAGGEFYDDVARAGAQMLITGEAKHHELLAARDMGVSMLLLGHHHSEALVLPRLAEKLRLLDPTLDVTVCDDEPEEYI